MHWPTQNIFILPTVNLNKSTSVAVYFYTSVILCCKLFCIVQVRVSRRVVGGAVQSAGPHLHRRRVGVGPPAASLLPYHHISPAPHTPSPRPRPLFRPSGDRPTPPGRPTHAHACSTSVAWASSAAAGGRRRSSQTGGQPHSQRR